MTATGLTRGAKSRFNSSKSRGVVVLGVKYRDGLCAHLLHQKRASAGPCSASVAQTRKNVALELRVGRRRRDHHHGHAEVLECLEEALVWPEL